MASAAKTRCCGFSAVASASFCLGAVGFLISHGAAAAVPRASLGLDLFAGGGYDSNLFLQVVALPDSPGYRSYSGAFGRVFPSAVASLAGDSLRLFLSAGSDIRQTRGSGTLFVEDAQLGLTIPELGPLAVQLAATGGKVDATIEPALRFFTVGGAANVTWRFADQLRARLDYRIARRVFGAPAEVGVDTDLSHIGQMRVGYAPTLALDLGISVDYLSLSSNLDAAAPDPSPRLQRFHAGLDSSFAAGAWCNLFASAWAGTQWTAAVDRQAGATAAVSVRLGPPLEVVARYDFLGDWAPDTSGYRRHVLMVGLAGHVGVAREARAPIPSEAGVAPAIAQQKVRFRIQASAAARVEVIGSWNDWATGQPGQQLIRTPASALWELWVPLPPGEHRYHFLVDAQPIRPADAPSYRADGFGGEDGVLEISR
jgi:hypothetical protein